MEEKRELEGGAVGMCDSLYSRLIRLWILTDFLDSVQTSDYLDV